jgi:hypothetical protein
MTDIPQSATHPSRRGFLGRAALVAAAPAGGGVLDRLLEQEVDVVGFKNGAAAYDSEHFINRRAELYWALRDMFDRDEIDIDPDDDQLAAQLGSIQ